MLLKVVDSAEEKPRINNMEMLEKASFPFFFFLFFIKLIYGSLVELLTKKLRASASKIYQQIMNVISELENQQLTSIPVISSVRKLPKMYGPVGNFRKTIGLPIHCLIQFSSSKPAIL